ncbi:MAG: [FeFe] hydrogenase H-cluster maturation GTPase HydF, partial [Clostridia bacterium]|nr:[FeFe] hydrogenase H-cluster maturation GTPase HydF [Clostridia bacterium]
MSLNETPSANRTHIGFFGCRNAGKSSLVNKLTNQQVAVVSDTKGTTTDPVTKAMELLPIGPVVIIDTPGYDDEGNLGELRVARTKRILNRTDAAVLVVDAEVGKNDFDRELEELFKKKNIPYVVAYNKSDISEIAGLAENEIAVSAESGSGVKELKDLIGKVVGGGKEKPMVSDLISEGDIVVLVIPIDSAAPKGRIILPQQQILRDVLDIGAIAAVCRETELKATLDGLSKKPALVITDSQAFASVSADTPEDIPLTSFSIIMARYKGLLKSAARGVYAIDKLKDGDKVLISEGCTHHRTCEDIGTVKIPKLLKKFTGCELVIDTSSGNGFPEDLSDYALIIHCGGCMINEREMLYRIKCAEDAGVPI